MYKSKPRHPSDDEDLDDTLEPRKEPPPSKPRHPSDDEDLDDTWEPRKEPPPSKHMEPDDDEDLDYPWEPRKEPPPSKPDEPVPVYGATWTSDLPGTIFTHDVVKMVNFVYVKTEWIFNLIRATIACTNETRMSPADAIEFSKKNIFTLDTRICRMTVEELTHKFAGKICRIVYTDGKNESTQEYSASLSSIQIQDIFRIVNFEYDDCGLRLTIERVNKTRMSPADAIEWFSKRYIDQGSWVSRQDDIDGLKKKFAGKICKITCDDLHGITNIQEILN